MWRCPRRVGKQVDEKNEARRVGISVSDTSRCIRCLIPGLIPGEKDPGFGRSGSRISRIWGNLRGMVPKIFGWFSTFFADL